MFHNYISPLNTKQNCKNAEWSGIGRKRMQSDILKNITDKNKGKDLKETSQKYID